MCHIEIVQCGRRRTSCYNVTSSYRIMCT